ncbi:MAG: amino acid ABC transporter substrate-binding protein, partial [Candidatus Electrothrix sp. GM3_4]|nr:amino acid ABC transporter substrate-binding protein [Candidatus Electrothrix sp. GM3_4]
YSSSGSAAAGPLYQSNGIPAITASATKEAATQKNEWFFRTIPGMRSMTEFAVHSMQKIPGITLKTASIIYDVNFYDTSVAEEFKKKTENIFDNLNRWSFDSNSDSKNNDIKKIIGEIRAEQSVGPIFFATTSKDSGDIISSFRYPGTDYRIIGLDSFAVPTFIRQFESYPNEQKSPGYYTNETYAVSPFISYLADQPNALAFRERFLRQYGKEPSWVAAAYYDAMLLALNAVEKAEVQGERIREDRRRVRNALNSFNKKDVAVSGVTGDLYFDEDGNINLPLALGVWQNHTFLPVYHQDQQQASDASSAGQADQADANKEKYTVPLRVVYTGVDINAIRNIDLKQGSFTADFYLWFRFQGVFDDTAVTFINARHPVTLGKPVMEATSDNITVRAYRVIADLKTDIKEATYPLDRQTLRISFQYDKKTRKELIYIPDVIGMKGSVGKKTGVKICWRLFPIGKHRK